MKVAVLISFIVFVIVAENFCAEAKSINSGSDKEVHGEVKQGEKVRLQNPILDEQDAGTESKSSVLKENEDQIKLPSNLESNVHRHRRDEVSDYEGWEKKR
ncbi:unnamed protein product [Allacma fusca]|uniref:Uncharacterized protein n=1 Tax=Allacma fusca TaxID=39272 RepID=A0A8J2JUW2_9HEXA|nr:unnamed protein product [Allacma fusca]